MLPEMNEAVFGTTALLSSLTTADHQVLQQNLRHNPDAGPQLVAALAGHGEKLGVPGKRREQLRNIVQQSTWRLQKQPPALLIDEYVGKVEKAARMHGQLEELRRYQATAISNRTFWEQQRRIAAEPPPDATKAGAAGRAAAADRYKALAALSPGELELRRMELQQRVDKIDADKEALWTELTEIAKAYPGDDSYDPWASPQGKRYRDLREESLSLLREIAAIDRRLRGDQPVAPLEGPRRRKIKQVEDPNDTTNLDAGAWILGVGVLIGIIGGAVTATGGGPVGWGLLTVGGILLLVGIIVMLYGVGDGESY